MRNVLYFLILSFTVVACKVRDVGQSELRVTSGANVTSPEQAPGVYRLHGLDKDGVPVLTASVVAVSPTTFFTSAHVIEGISALNLRALEVVDFRGEPLVRFALELTTAKFLVHPIFRERGSISHDIAAIVLKNPLSTGRLTQGFTSLASKAASTDQSIYLVGAGIRDYRDLSKGKSRISLSALTPLAYGYNQVAELDPFGFYINGVAFVTPDIQDRSVSGPGDSGGAAFMMDQGRVNGLIGLMQGGTLFKVDPKTGAFIYYDYKSDPDNISKQENLAYSYVVSPAAHPDFLNQVVAHGGQVEGWSVTTQLVADSKYLFKSP